MAPQAIKLPRLKSVVGRDGRRRYYYRAGPRALVPLPDPMKSVDAFMRAYQAAVRKHGDVQRQPSDDVSVSGVFQSYRRSTDWSELSASSRESYERHIGYALKWIGEAHIASVTTADLYKLRDLFADRPGTGRQVIACLTALFRYAKRRGHREDNPAIGIEKIATDPHKAWPDDLLSAVLVGDDVVMRRAVAAHLYSGQRTGDVCAMRWDQIRDGAIFVRQQKTGKELHIPIHHKWAAELDATPRLGETIIANRAGKPLSPDAFRRWAAAVRADLVPHGLRKNAVNALLEVGCTTAEVSAITGQSLQMVEHYAKQVNQRLLAMSAIRRWGGERM